MKLYKSVSIIILSLNSLFCLAQIPKDHFIDADDSSPNGYKLKPFIQKEKGIYHYSILSELPFDNSCSDKESKVCSENTLRKSIYNLLNNDLNFRGNVYVYLSVDSVSKANNIKVSSYPKSERINQAINKAIHKIDFKVGKYKDKKVISRLWTSLSFPSSSNELFSESLKRLKSDNDPQFSKYEMSLFDATEYIFSNPVNIKSKEFISATQIASHWMNSKYTAIPTFGKFHKALTNKQQQQFLYNIAMLNYQLSQKLNHNNVLDCIPDKKSLYKDRKDVKEVQLEGAKILLDFIGDSENNVPMNSDTKKIYKLYKKGKLEEKFF